MLSQALKKLRESRGIGVNQLAMKSGVSASQISRIENGVQRNPKLDTITKLSAALGDVQQHLLVTFVEDQTNGSANDRHLAERINGRESRAAHNSNEVPFNNDLPSNAIPVTAAETVQIPVYGEIQAGVATLAEQNVIGQLDVKKGVVERYGYDNLFALKVRGESMNRKIINGHTAVFCKDIQPESGDIVAVMIDHEDATVKRYKETSIAVMFEPESWDNSFKPYVFPKIGEQDFRILGRYIYDTSESI